MRFGVIGCGLIAQVMHIPYLAELPRTDLVGLVDPVVDRAETLADRYNVEHVSDDHESLIERVDLDAVIVLTPSHTHADVAVDTLHNGIDTLVEKPIAATIEDANRMVTAAERSDGTAMVAYMKRYDPSYERAKGSVEDLEAVDLVTAYDVDPDHGRIIDEVYEIVEANPPQDFIEQSASDRRRDIETVIGTDDDTLVGAYDFQVEHVCHDVNALRGLFGTVEQINHVDIFADGRYMTARLGYEGGVECVLESGDSNRKWFEEFIRVDGPNGMVTVEFSNPFIKNTPTELRVKRGIEELTDAVHTPSNTEPFKRELKHFIECIDGKRTVRTPFEEARDDLELIVDLFLRYRGELSETRS